MDIDQPNSEIDLDAAIALGEKINKQLEEHGFATYEAYPDCGVYGLTIDDLRKNCCNDMDGTKVEESSIPAFADEISKHGVTEVIAQAYVEGGLLRLCEVSFALAFEPSEEVLDQIMSTTSFHIDGAQEGKDGTFWLNGNAE